VIEWSLYTHNCCTCSGPELLRFLGSPLDDAIHAHQQEASEKRQGTKFGSADGTSKDLRVRLGISRAPNPGSTRWRPLIDSRKVLTGHVAFRVTPPVVSTCDVIGAVMRAALFLWRLSGS
jgi:hypothetical protein